MTHPQSNPDRKPRRGFRRIVLVVLSAIVILLIAFVIFLPQIAGTSPGLVLINRMVNTDPDLKIEINELDLRWSGRQRISAIRINRDHGAVVADLSVDLTGSLWGWAVSGSRDFGTVAIEGAVQIDESKLNSARRSQPSPSAASTPRSNAAVTLPENLRAQIELRDLQIGYTADPSQSLSNAASVKSVELNHLTGNASIDSAADSGTVKWSFKADSKVGDSNGKLTTLGTITGFVKTSNGSVEPENAQCDINLESSAIPVAIFDALLSANGQLTSLLGPEADIKTNISGSFSNGGDATLRITSSTADFNLNARINSRAITLTQAAPSRLRLSPGSIPAFIPSDDRLRNAFIRTTGAVSVDLQSAELPISKEGTFDLAAAKVDVRIYADLDEIDLDSQSFDTGSLSNFTARIFSANLADQIDLTCQGTANFNNTSQNKNESTFFDASWTLRQPVDSTGRFQFAATDMSGTVSAQNIPTSIIDETARLDHWLNDAVGGMHEPVLKNLQITLASDDSASRMMRATVSADSPNGQAHLVLQIDDHGIAIIENDDQSPQFELRATPAFNARLEKLISTASNEADTPLFDFAGFGRCTITIPELQIPFAKSPFDFEGLPEFETALRLSAINANINLEALALRVQIPTLTTQNDEHETGAVEPDTMTVSSLRTEISSDSLSDHLTVQIDLDGLLNSSPDAPFTVSIPINVAHLFDPLNRTTKARFIINDFFNSSLVAALSLRESQTEAELSADSKITIDQELISRLFSDNLRFDLLDPGVFSVFIAPMRLPRSADSSQSISWDALASSAPAEVQFQSPTLRIAASPTFANPVAINDFEATLNWTRGFSNPVSQIVGSAVLHDAESKKPIAKIDFNTQGRRGSDSSWGEQLSVALDDVDVERLEEVLGYESQTLVRLLGNRGALSFDANPDAILNLSKGEPNKEALHIVARFPRFNADVGAHTNDSGDQIVVDPGGALVFTVDQSTAQDLVAALYRSDDESGEPLKEDLDHIVVKDDVRASLDLREMAISTGAFSDGRVTLDELAVDADLSLNPIPLAAVHGTTQVDSFTWSEFKTSLNSEIGSPSVEFVLDSKIKNRSESPELFRKLVLGVDDSTSATPQANVNPLDLIKTVLGTNDDNQNQGAETPDSENSNPDDQAAKTEPVRNADGAIRFSGRARNLFTPAPSPADPRPWRIENLTGKLTNVPVPFVDILAGSSGTLTAALGSNLGAEITSDEFGPGIGSIQLDMTSRSGNLHITGAEFGSDGTLRIGQPSRNATMLANQTKENYAWPASVSLDITPDMSRAVLDSINPIFYDIRKKSGPILGRADYLRIPLDGNLANLDADLILDLGLIDVPSNGLFGDLLGSAKEAVGESTSASVPPVPIRVRSGVLKYDGLVLQAEKFKVTTGGEINLVERTLNLRAAVPLIGWQSVFGQMTSALRNPVTDWNIPFYLVITGSIDDPDIKPDPKGAQRVADELFKNTIDQTLGNIFEQILKDRGDNQKKKKKGRKEKNGGDGGGGG